VLRGFLDLRAGQFFIEPTTRREFASTFVPAIVLRWRIIFAQEPSGFDQLVDQPRDKRRAFVRAGLVQVG
jgi:hypothetical protein